MKFRQILAKSHHLLGLMSAVLILWVSLSGVILNHSSGFGLNQPLPTPMLSFFYGIQKHQNNWPVDWTLKCKNNKVHYNSILLDLSCGEVKSYIMKDDLVVLLTPQQITLWLHDGQMLESLAIESLGLGRIVSFGETKNGLVVLVDENGQQRRADAQFLSWKASSKAMILKEAYMLEPDVNSDIDWERLMLDLHAGRFLGVTGKILNDGVAIILIYMCLSGVWLWFHRNSRNKKRLRNV